MKYFTRTITTYTYRFAKSDGIQITDVTDYTFGNKITKSAKAKLMDDKGFNVELGVTENQELRRMSIDVFMEHSEPVPADAE